MKQTIINIIRSNGVYYQSLQSFFFIDCPYFTVGTGGSGGTGETGGPGGQGGHINIGNQQ